MFVTLLDYIMFIIVTAMSRNVISYITCMFYSLCKVFTVIKMNKFIYLCYIDTVISVCGIMLISNNMINKVIIRFLDLKLSWLCNDYQHQLYIGLDSLYMLFVLLKVLLSDIYINGFQPKQSGIYYCC